MLYNNNRANSTSNWTELNINIKTAVIEMAKHYMNEDFTGGTFWNAFLINDWPTMSNNLKSVHSSSACLECLRSAYLIDSVTTRCNKHQSVNFLVDQSGSVGSTAFQ